MISQYTYFFDELQKLAYDSNIEEAPPKKKSLLDSDAAKAGIAGSVLYSSYKLSKALAKNPAARAAAGLGAAGLVVKGVENYATGKNKNG